MNAACCYFFVLVSLSGHLALFYLFCAGFNVWVLSSCNFTVCNLHLFLLLIIVVPRYVPEDQRELQSICERVSPRLQHVNAAVVLSAVKVIMKLLAAMADEDYKTALLAKLAPPLVTLLSSEPEIQ